MLNAGESSEVGEGDKYIFFCVWKACHRLAERQGDNDLPRGLREILQGRFLDLFSVSILFMVFHCSRLKMSCSAGEEMLLGQIRRVGCV